MRWLAFLLLLSFSGANALAQSSGTEEDAAVGQSINYVFATDLGSGVYDLDGRSLQIYRFTYEKGLRETREDQLGVRFVLPVTAGFFDFSPVDVISEGPPTRVDSFSVVPGLELDHLMANDWHFIPYARAGFSVASSQVNGLLYGVGFRLERRFDTGPWNAFYRTEFVYAGVRYRHETPNDEFSRVRQAFDFTRGTGWKIRGHELEFGVYAICDAILDPPTAPVADAGKEPGQIEFGVTIATRPRVKIWKFDTPRLGLGYRMAGDLSAFRIVLGVPF
ncbi:MAG TPA: hypothetical protein VMF52_01210 [Steroidobacteraceae bacterium]|nr:hypothetical protein [Steroidobacteraceae bacterium]